MGQWAVATEKAIGGNIMRSRSSFVSWAAVIGCTYHPRFAVNLALVRHIRWALMEERGMAGSATRLQQLEEDWEWIYAGEGRFGTPWGNS